METVRAESAIGVSVDKSARRLVFWTSSRTFDRQLVPTAAGSDGKSGTFQTWRALELPGGAADFNDVIRCSDD